MGNGVRGDWGGWGPTLQGCWKETQGNPEHCWDRPACAAASAVWGLATQHALDLPALLRNPQGWLSSRCPHSKLWDCSSWCVHKMLTESGWVVPPQGRF